MMGKVYEHVTRFESFKIIYQQGLSFGVAGKYLIESKDPNLFVPGMINICLATEIFLKSINASQSYLEDEIEIGGKTIIRGRDETMKIIPGGRGHELSKLFDELPAHAKEEITLRAVRGGFHGDIFEGLRQYDEVFVDWRYIYEKRNAQVLGTSPLFNIFNAVDSYCASQVGKIITSVSNEIDEPSWNDEQKKKESKKKNRH